MNQKQKQGVTLLLVGVALIGIAGMGYEYRANQLEASTQSSMNEYVPPDLDAAGGGESWTSKPWGGGWDDGESIEDYLSYSFVEASGVSSKSAKSRGGKGGGVRPDSGRLRPGSEKELERAERASRSEDVLSFSVPECGYDDSFHWSQGGQCRDDTGKAYDRVWTYSSDLEKNSLESCKGFCDSFAADGYRGLSYYKFDRCYCHYDAGTNPGCPEGLSESCRVSKSNAEGVGSVGGVSNIGTVYSCHPYESCADM